jgi:HAD superfamily hydrolase (TIGR01509 family)
MPSPVEAILFDFDGVLADTEPLHFECWIEVLRPLGMSLTWDNYAAHCIGISDREFLETLGRVATPPRGIDELWPLYPLKKQLFAQRAVTGNLIDPALKQLLQSLTSVPLAVVTSSSKLEISAILHAEKVLGLFRVAVYGDEVANLKPHPEPYLTAMNRLGVSSALALEDSSSGIRSARAAGCEVIEVPSPAEVPRLLRERLAR